MNEIRRIVVGVDGSTGSIHALRWALDEARLRHDVVEVVHVWHVPSFPDMSGMAPYPAAALEEAAHAVLARVMADVASETHDVTVTSRAEQGNGADGLIEASKSADLLVVGRRGHGGFLSLIMGSVAEQVAGHAECPVVIVAP